MLSKHEKTSNRLKEHNSYAEPSKEIFESLVLIRRKMKEWHFKESVYKDFQREK